MLNLIFLAFHRAVILLLLCNASWENSVHQYHSQTVFGGYFCHFSNVMNSKPAGGLYVVQNWDMGCLFSFLLLLFFHLSSSPPLNQKHKQSTKAQIKLLGKSHFIKSHIQKEYSMLGCYKTSICTSYHTDQHCSVLNDTLHSNKCVWTQHTSTHTHTHIHTLNCFRNTGFTHSTGQNSRHNIWSFTSV